MITKIVAVGCCLMLLAAGGCSATYNVVIPRSTEGVEFHTARTLKSSGKSYEVVGMAHVERWNPTMYWLSAENRLQNLVTVDLVQQARLLGADAIVNVNPKAENHYEMAVVIFFVPFVFGWEEGHAGGLMVRYTD